jgi:ATP-dependent DNA helicase DinG
MSKSVELLKQTVSLKPGGEVRTQQEIAVGEIEAALNDKVNLLLEAPTGSGKALALHTPILTSTGWKTMGTLAVNDQIYGLNGQLTTVTKTHEPFLSEKLYKVAFANGETILADSDHLWNIERVTEADEEVFELNFSRVNELASKKVRMVSPTGELVDVVNSATPSDFPIPEIAIFNTVSSLEPVFEDDHEVHVPQQQFMENLYVELLGRAATWKTSDLYWHMEQTGNHEPMFTVPVVESLDFSHTRQTLPALAMFFGEWLNGDNEVFTAKEIQDLQAAGVEKNDRIPEVYKLSSKNQRRQVLLGLFEGELLGTLTTRNEQLAKDVLFLARSLNLDARYETGISPEKVRLHAVTLTGVPAQPLAITSIEVVESEMVRCITVDSEDHLFLAGELLIPTHNTLSYLIPLVETGGRAVISTATKQLSEQIMDVDIKFLNKALKELNTGKRADATLLKGRDNYYCLSKADDMQKLDDTANTMFSMDEVSTPSTISGKGKQMMSEAKALAEWGDTTKTGDRSHGPNVSDEMWRQYSSTTTECPGKAACPFGEVCFAERAREKAHVAPIVVTNHAIVALDLASEGKLLGDRDAFILDELHEVDNYLSSAWGAELTYKKLESAYKLLKSIPSLEEENVAAMKPLLDEYDASLRSVAIGLLDSEDTSVKLENYIIKLYNTIAKLAVELNRKEKAAGSDALKRIYTGAKKVVDELADMANILSTRNIETVRWTADSEGYKNKYSAPKSRKAKPKVVDRNENASTVSMHAAPLRIGPKLQQYFTEREAIMIGLSATVTVSGKFDIPLHNFGLEEKPNKTVILDSPFDFKKQAMLYIPPVNGFPLPVGAERVQHSETVQKESLEFLKAAGGRTLMLSSTTSGAEKFTEFYRENTKLPILSQGEHPMPYLVKKFKDDEESSLVGTMGLWHGLDAPGPTLILGMVDKLPFPSPDDPLLSARKNYADKMGRNGFMEIYVTVADWYARQAFGRVIRSKSDRAVFVFWDVRLLTKGYGKAILGNLHGVGLYQDKQKVLAALTRLADSHKK